MGGERDKVRKYWSKDRYFSIPSSRLRLGEICEVRFSEVWVYFYKYSNVYILVLTRKLFVSPGWSTSCMAQANMAAKTSKSVNTF